jgi:hypothetical protein
MTREVRCPMRECRSRVDLDAPAGCMHFIAAWGALRGAMIEEVLAGLDGNREFVIRNIRPVELPAASSEGAQADLEATIERYAHVVRSEAGGGALFGDEFERNGLARALARLMLGVDPVATGSITGGAR